MGSRGRGGRGQGGRRQGRPADREPERERGGGPQDGRRPPPDPGQNGAPEQPSGAAPYYGPTPPGGVPRYRGPRNGVPQNGTPAYGTPAYGGPRYAGPRYGPTPPNGTPVYRTPPPHGMPPGGPPRYGGRPGGVPPHGVNGTGPDLNGVRPNGVPRNGVRPGPGPGRPGPPSPGREQDPEPDRGLISDLVPDSDQDRDHDRDLGADRSKGLPPHRPARYRSEQDDDVDVDPPNRYRGTDRQHPTGGRAQRRRAAKRAKRRRRLRATREVPILVVTALLIALLLKTFLVQAFSIPSGSMENTIQVGDRVVVDKLTPWFGSKPSRGDVVVFRDPGGWLDGQPPPKEDPPGIKQIKTFFTFIGLLPSADEQDLIKRVVAVGGDTVICCDKDGLITVNGQPLDEPYLRPGGEPSKIKFKVQVPRGRLFMMGDNRSNSADSRFHLDEEHNGTVPEKLVVGRAFVIAWPTGHWRGLEEPETYASVPERAEATTAAGGANNPRGTSVAPIPVELPIVMSVVGMLPGRVARRFGLRARSRARGGQHFREE